VGAAVLRLKIERSRGVRDGRRLDRGRWKLVSEIQAMPEIAPKPRDKAGVSDCVRCWVKLGWLPQKKVTKEQTGGRVPGRWRAEGKRSPEKKTGKGERRIFADLKDVKRFRTLTLIDFDKFKELWEQDFVGRGAQLLRHLVQEHNGRCPLKTAKDRLAEIGIAGRGRRARVAEAANMKARPDRGIGATRGWYYVPANGKKDPVKIVRSLLPADAGDGLRRARERGLTTEETYAALRKLGVPLQPEGQVGPWTWRLLGTEPVTCSSEQTAGDNGQPATPTTGPQVDDARPRETRTKRAREKHLEWERRHLRGDSHQTIALDWEDETGEETTEDAVKKALKRLRLEREKQQKNTAK
jgi:hypothetical protein